MIINKINGKTYVGKRKFISKKSWENDGYMGSGKKLKSAKMHYGVDNFEKFLITYTSSEKDACEKEKFWIAYYKSIGKAEYNIAKGGEGGDTGQHKRGFYEGFTPWNKGKQGVMPTPWNKGKHHTAESNEKNRLSHLGKTPWNKDKKLSEEHKKNLSDSHKGNKQSEETKRKISETMKKIRAAQKAALD